MGSNKKLSLKSMMIVVGLGVAALPVIVAFLFHSFQSSGNTELARQVAHTLLWSGLLSGLLVLVLGSVAYYWVLKHNFIEPLHHLLAATKQIQEGSMLHKEIPVERDDEIGHVTGVINKLILNLDQLLNRATFIAMGQIGANEAEEKMKRGATLESAAKIESSEENLAGSFDVMQGELRKLTIQARKIAADELDSPVLDVQIAGELGDAFREMTINLKEIAAVARRIADQDLTTQVVIRSDTSVLGKAFAMMSYTLKSLIKTITEIVNDTYRAANEMAQTTEQSSHTMGDVQNSIQQIATATGQISKSAQQISALMQNANKTVDAGTENIAQVIRKFSELQSTISATGNSISKLEQRSNEISEIVGLITKIADQTNLLALNAAIEAARAGEAGRGFAVVADEVRKLAESSGQSAGNISRIIREIQQDTAVVVSSSQGSLEEAKGVLNLATRMRDGYNEIVESIKGMGQEVEQIAAVSEETASSAEEISSGAEEQTSAITEIANNAHGLVTQAGKLKAEIDKFRM
jgi:methyl-accepting chemotaxis protein